MVAAEGESESMTGVVSEQGPGNRVISWGISTLSPGESPGLYAGCCGRHCRVCSGRSWGLLRESAQEAARVEAGEPGRKFLEQPWL